MKIECLPSTLLHTPWGVRKRYAVDRSSIPDKHFEAAKAALQRCGGSPTQIYAIRSGEFVKFGVSKNPSGRFRGIRTDNPHGLDLLGAMWASDAVEKAVHGYLASYRHSGEWFKWGGAAIAVAMLIAKRDLDGLLDFIQYTPSELICGVPRSLDVRKAEPSFYAALEVAKAGIGAEALAEVLKNPEGSFRRKKPSKLRQVAEQVLA